MCASINPSNGEVLATLYAAHVTGKVLHLNLCKTGDKYFIRTVSENDLPGVRACWLTWDPTNKLLYVSDESQKDSKNALVVFEAAEDGRLTEKAQTKTAFGAVSTGLYAGPGGKLYLASAHYPSAIFTTFELPLTHKATEHQRFHYDVPGSGANPLRQDISHPHHAVADPTHSFVVVPDLGLDLTRVYVIDKSNGKLTEIPPARSAAAGDGPRHATFWKKDDITYLFVVNELANSVSGYEVKYAEPHPTFEWKQSLSTYGDDVKPPAHAIAAAIKAHGNDLYVTNRGDPRFETSKASHSITHFSIGNNGTLTFSGVTPTHGLVPRTFDINAKGDLVAIANQQSSTLVIVPRNQETGDLGEPIVNTQVGPESYPWIPDGKGCVLEGLGAVLWV